MYCSCECARAAHAAPGVSAGEIYIRKATAINTQTRTTSYVGTQPGELEIISTPEKSLTRAALVHLYFDRPQGSLVHTLRFSICHSTLLLYAAANLGLPCNGLA
jgi:hypothetical protein